MLVSAKEKREQPSHLGASTTPEDLQPAQPQLARPQLQTRWGKAKPPLFKVVLLSPQKKVDWHRVLLKTITQVHAHQD